MGFSRQEYWSGLPFPSSGALPNPGMEPRSPVLQVDSLLTEPPGTPNINDTGNALVKHSEALLHASLSLQLQDHPVVTSTVTQGLTTAPPPQGPPVRVRGTLAIEGHRQRVSLAPSLSSWQGETRRSQPTQGGSLYDSFYFT